ncbi:MAG: hypothetical protein JRC93_09165 [Deltaproteobacteria bacterium]|nr:hypothetical protein [Deltaproteobacteria bacterium]
MTDEIKEFPDLDIEITDIPDKEESETVKKTDIPKNMGKPTFASAKKHPLSLAIDELYLESMNKVLANKEGNITSAHDIGAALYYTVLFYAPQVPTEHPATYILMAVLGCGIDVMAVLKGPDKVMSP